MIAERHGVLLDELPELLDRADLQADWLTAGAHLHDALTALADAVRELVNALPDRHPEPAGPAPSQHGIDRAVISLAAWRATRNEPGDVLLRHAIWRVVAAVDETARPAG